MSEHLLDAIGLKCPLPVLKARKVMKPLQAGEVLRILATDPSARQDFQSFCETTGYRLISIEDRDDVTLEILIEKT
ncbi:sulfurtransferase TusA family protein [Kiloniella sp. b19]|uniref:sulfurtransferase TusA family protein n=1 Tax=Kiloniella sp. GXU_MW_B19 TaxID=3141326 RepID=UPI0031DE9379